MQLFLARHGETIENKRRIVTGRNHGHLSIAGIGQAIKLGRFLKKYRFIDVFSSSLYRAVVTTQLIVAYQKDVNVSYLDLLQEMDFGEYTGKRTNQVDWGIQAINGETPAEVINRVKSFLDSYIVDKYSKDDKVLVVCHHLIINAFIVHLSKKDPSEIKTLGNQQPNILNVLEVDIKRGDVKLSLLDTVKSYS